tara:strand:+ start:638 stop:892 length:255 start_codon:yes stop_codon:yes gene_type:complete
MCKDSFCAVAEPLLIERKKRIKTLAGNLKLWYSYHMTIKDLAKQDSREIHDQDVRDVQALLAEVMENDNIPFNSEGSDQEPAKQ